MSDDLLTISAYVIEGPDFPGDPFDITEIKRTGGVIDNLAVFAELDHWKIERRGWVLSDEGKWTQEPMPSSRDTHFLLHHRFTLADAIPLAKKHSQEPMAYA